MAHIGTGGLFLLLVAARIGGVPTSLGVQEQGAGGAQQAVAAQADAASAPVQERANVVMASQQGYAAAVPQQQPAVLASYGLGPRRRQRRNALRHRRRRRLDNPRYYYPNGDYSVDTEVGWDNYHRRSVRESAENPRRQESYQASYVAPAESGAVERFKADESRKDVEQDYSAAGFDYRAAGSYPRQNYQKQRRAALPSPPKRNAKQWGSWDYGQVQQSWNARYPQYDYGDAAMAYVRKEPSRFYAREEAASMAEQTSNVAAQSNYAAEVAGQDGVVERAGDVPPAAAAQ